MDANRLIPIMLALILVTGVSVMLTIPTTTIPAHAQACPSGQKWDNDLKQCIIVGKLG